PKLGFNKTVAYVNYSKPTIIKWLHRYHQNKNLNSRKRPGPKHITAIIQDKKIVQMTKKKIFITSTKIQKELENKDVK
ncbi:16960_t:CDS:1, partial [Cetraspora pellucida]